jgi:hypothetical protein
VRYAISWVGEAMPNRVFSVDFVSYEIPLFWGLLFVLISGMGFVSLLVSPNPDQLGFALSHCVKDPTG